MENDTTRKSQRAPRLPGRRSTHGLGAIGTLTRAASKARRSLRQTHGRGQTPPRRAARLRSTPRQRGRDLRHRMRVDRWSVGCRGRWGYSPFAPTARLPGASTTPAPFR